MKILANYLYANWKSISFLPAFIFFAMDMSGILGGWGYILYYPMLFILAIYCIINAKKIGIIYLFYLITCLISIVLNDIPPYYRIYSRYLVFILLLLSFSNLVNSRKIALMRLHAFHIFSILTVILVTINYIFFSLGIVKDEALALYEERGLYTGSTANNEMGVLGAIAIMFIITYSIKFFRQLSSLSKFILLICLISAISMMAMASSRMGLLCTIFSILFVICKLNSNNIRKIFISLAVIILGGFLVSTFMGDKFRFMLEKNGNQVEELKLNSREDMWMSRLKEYKESPVYGVGFGYMKYGWGNAGAEKNQGRIESGSGWASVISQTGTLGAICIVLMVIPNLLYLIRKKSTSYCSAWYSGMCVMFILQPITEAYITTVGAVLCCLFWLNYSVIESFRKGILGEEDLDLSIYSQYKLFDRKLLKLKHK